MPSAFGVDHTPISKKRERDYSRAKSRWEKNERVANRVENAGGTVAATGGALLGGAALRDAAFKDHPTLKAKAIAHSTALPAKVGEGLVHTKPGFKTLAAIGAGTAVGYTGNKHRRLAEKKVARYSVSKAEPGSLMHAHDLEVVSKMGDRELSHRKKVQAGVAVGASTLGLSALGAKGAGAIMPKLGRVGKTPRARAYARKLDRDANTLAIGATGVGGAGGYNFAAIQNAEAKRKTVAKLLVTAARQDALVSKAFDSERSRQRRAKAGEAGAVVGAAGAAGMAARPQKKLVMVNRASAAKKINQGAAELTYGRNMKGAHRGVNAEQAGKKILAGLGQAASGKMRVAQSGVSTASRGKWAGAAVAGAAGAAGIHHHRKDAGKPYQGRYGR